MIYDFIHDYLVNEYFDSAEFKNGRHGELWAPGHPQGKEWAMERIHTFFQKYMDNKINRAAALRETGTCMNTPPPCATRS